MYQKNGTYYNEKHSISFGDLGTETSADGTTYEVFKVKANTWDTWHLIPSSRPAIVHPNPVTKIVEIPGTDGALDLSEYLTGRVNYGQRSGSISFYVDNDHENWETIRQNMAFVLHGKTMKMRLEDDPNYYYQGRFTVGNWESGASYSSISIGYQLDPYKFGVSTNPHVPVLWDPFNFETDIDYYSSFSDSIGTGTYTIYAYDMPFTVNATWVTGSCSVTFGGVTKFIHSAGTYALGLSSPGKNKLIVSPGNGKIKVSWRGGML